MRTAANRGGDVNQCIQREARYAAMQHIVNARLWHSTVAGGLSLRLAVCLDDKDGNLWAGKIVRHMRNHQVTVHGLDIGIHADMTVFSSFSALVYNDGSWILGTSRMRAIAHCW